jgi:ABC-2 type transport system ATP-binding protein
MLAIETRALTRTFKKKRGELHTALDRVDLSVPAGGIFGLLGPNGAGKTTLIKILVTLLYPTSGTAKVDGVDVVAEPRKVRPRINMVSGGETSGYGILTVRENVWMFAQFYGIPWDVTRRRTEEYLERFGLAADADTRINRLSTGMRQKMNLIRGLVTDPKILFLDEPTLGLDAHIAREIRRFLSEWVRERPERTILLTTHYMAEAEEMCGSVAIIDRGKIVACDAPAALRRNLGDMGFYRLTLVNGRTDAEVFRAIPGLSDLEVRQAGEPTQREITFRLASEEVLGQVFARAQEGGARVVEFVKHEPGLEDLFVKIVGRKLSETE